MPVSYTHLLQGQLLLQLPLASEVVDDELSLIHISDGLYLNSITDKRRKYSEYSD